MGISPPTVADIELSVVQTAASQNNIQLQVKHNGTAPEKSRPEDAAYDLRSAQSRALNPGSRMLVNTGFNMAVPNGYAGLVCSRSGLALKHGVFVLNAPGIIDPGYIGDVGIILQNLGDDPFYIEKGDRIAQLIFVKMQDVQFVTATNLESNDRGANGFGSSGVA